MFCCTAQLVLVVNYFKFVMAHRPRRASQTKRIPRGEDLSGLNSEVLKLRLGALNLPVTGSKGQLQNRLKRALLGNSAKPRSSTGNSKRQKRTSSRSHVNARPGWSTRQNNVDRRNTGEIETFPIRQNSSAVASQEQEQEDSALSDHASFFHRGNDRVRSRDRHRQPTEHLVQFSSALRHRGNCVTISPHRLKRLLHSNKRSQPTRICPLVLLVRLLLWAFQDQLTVVWRTKYSGVSTLILLCYYRTTYISPRSLRSSSVWMTRPQAPWVPPSPWLEGQNPSLTRSRNGSTPIWSTC